MERPNSHCVRLPIFSQDSADDRLEAASAEDRAKGEGVRDQGVGDCGLVQDDVSGGACD